MLATNRVWKLHSLDVFCKERCFELQSEVKDLIARCDQPVYKKHALTKGMLFLACVRWLQILAEAESQVAPGLLNNTEDPAVLPSAWPNKPVPTPAKESSCTNGNAKKGASPTDFQEEGD